MRGRPFITVAVGVAACAAIACTPERQELGSAAELRDERPAAEGDAARREPTLTETDEALHDLQRVFDQLTRARLDMTRLLIEAGHPTAETQAYLEALFDQPALGIVESNMGRHVAQGTAPVTEWTTRVLEHARFGSCTAANVEVRFPASAVAPGGDGVIGALVVLKPLDPARDPGRLNPSGWVIVDEQLEGVPMDLTKELPCEPDTS